MDEFIIIIILIMAALLVWVIYSIIQNRNNTEAEAKAKLYKAQADLCDATRQLFNTNMHVVDLMTGIEFEHFVAELLPDFGYRNVQVTKASGDEGADVIAVNQNGARVCIQCKHYSGSVGFDAVKEVYTAKSLYACDIAMVITNSYFTKQAMESAQRLNVKLYDRDKLWSIMSTSFEMKLDNYREARDRTNALLDERYGMDDRFKRETYQASDNDAHFQSASGGAMRNQFNELDK